MQANLPFPPTACMQVMQLNRDQIRWIDWANFLNRWRVLTLHPVIHDRVA